MAKKRRRVIAICTNEHSVQATQIRVIFEDDEQRTNTQTLSNVIETIHVFVDCLSGITDAWETFSRSEIALFTRHAPEKIKWPEILFRINRNMSELNRLRRLLITKRELFRFKLESVSNVSIVPCVYQTCQARCRSISQPSQEYYEHVPPIESMPVYPESSNLTCQATEVVLGTCSLLLHLMAA